MGEPGPRERPGTEPAGGGSHALSLDDREAYGAAFADVYDQWYGTVTDAEATADFVEDRCPSSVVLELGVGSGRLAGPLADRGLTVVGLDSSAAMLERCRDDVLRVRADMIDLPLAPRRRGGTGLTALCGFNTVFNLPDGRAQGRLFRQLSPVADVVIVEAVNAAALAHAPGRSTGVSRDTATGVVVSSTVNEPARQLLVGRHLEIDDDRVRVRPWLLRWARIEQLDAMAAAAGYRQAERWGSWSGDRFGPDATSAITVFRRSSPGSAPC